MIQDHYIDKWRQFPYTDTGGVVGTGVPTPITIVQQPSPEELAEFRLLLERAREYDKRNGQPECGLEDKKKALLALAEHFGVKIDFL